MPTRILSPAHLRNHPTQLPEAVESALASAKSRTDLNAFIRFLDARALAHAQRVVKGLQTGADLPLAGYILAVKDNIAIEGTPLTCGSKILRGFESIFTATAISRLEEAGAVIIGKTNLDEFAMGSSTENSAFGPAIHPHFPDRVPGGSSGGSAVAVAAGWVHAALGSETGGSVRQPASFCGIVGLKPTYGRISRYGLVAFGSSLDQISPFASDCESAYHVLRAMSGPDEFDSTASDMPPPPAIREEFRSVPRLKIGLPKELFGEGLEPDVEQVVRAAVEALRRAGHSLIEISLPHSKYAIPVYYIVATAEASSNLARFDGVRYGYRHEGGSSMLDLYELTRSEGFGEEVRRRIMMGSYVLSAGYYDAYYRKAQQVRRQIHDEFMREFESVDVMLAPTSPTTAFRIGERVSDPLAMYLSDILTVPANLVGIPAVNVPVGRDSNSLPIGLQLMGPHFAEELILRLGAEIESLVPFESGAVAA